MVGVDGYLVALDLAAVVDLVSRIKCGSPDPSGMKSLLLCIVLLWSAIACGRQQSADSNTQELEMVFAKLVLGGADLTIAKGGTYIMPAEYQLLRDTGVKGQLLVRGIQRRGTGNRRARALVVMFRSVRSPTTLLEPYGTNGVYLQTERGFLLLPTNTPTSKEKLYLNRREYPGGPGTDWALKVGTVPKAGRQSSGTEIGTATDRETDGFTSFPTTTGAFWSSITTARTGWRSGHSMEPLSLIITQLEWSVFQIRALLRGLARSLARTTMELRSHTLASRGATQMLSHL